MRVIFNHIMVNLRLGYYRYIGSGSCRDVFDLGNGYVVKVARNMAGIAQNKSEYKISHRDNSGLFAKVIQVSDDFCLLIMEKAEEINNISYIFRYFNYRNGKELIDSEELQRIKKEYNLVLGDFERKSSWGIIDGRPVIIDYGFTKEVSRKYY